MITIGFFSFLIFVLVCNADDRLWETPSWLSFDDNAYPRETCSYCKISVAKVQLSMKLHKHT